jgi:hypothetical protein
MPEAEPPVAQYGGLVVRLQGIEIVPIRWREFGHS